MSTRSIKPLRSQLKKGLSSYRLEAKRLLYRQMYIWVGLALGVGVLFGKAALHAFVIGALIGSLPQLYLYYRLFAWQGARQAKKMVKALWHGQVAKFILTAVGMAAALSVKGVLPLWLLLGQCAAYWGWALVGLKKVSR